MKKTQTLPSPAAPKFDPKKYTRGGLLSELQIIKAKQYFDLLDPNSTGTVNPKQIKQALLLLGSDSANHPVYQLICDYEADGKGSIGFEDFLHLLTHTVTQRDSRSDLRKVFSLYDDDKTGFISIQNLRRVARDVGEDITQQQIQSMLKYADKDNDGRISVEQFYALVTRKSSI